MGTLASVISKQITNNIFPRLLVISPKVEINPSLAEIVYVSYDLNNLDFRDKLTGLALVYDVIIEQTIVKKTKRSPIWIDSQEITQVFNTVKEIRINTIEGNDPSKIGCTLYYKVYAKVTLIDIKYVQFQDILGELGGFYGTFGLVGQIIALSYSSYFSRADMLNAVFKFHIDDDDDEDDDDDNNNNKGDGGDGGDGKELKKSKSQVEMAIIEDKKTLNSNFQYKNKIAVQEQAAYKNNQKNPKQGKYFD
jgi:hypothetical protein